jgi:hypothetical protein
MVVVALLVVLLAVLLPMLTRSRRAGDPVGDARDLSALHQAMVIFARSHTGALPVPARAVNSDDATLNTSANLFSLVLADRGITAKQLISRAERNPVVRAIEYDFAAVNAAEGRPWDPAFRTELDKPAGEGACHTSYAHLALCGERIVRWREASDDRAVLFGDRATRRGVQKGRSWSRSYTLGRHGHPDGVWAGNLVFGDGHGELVTTYRPEGVSWTCGSIKPTKDNIFDCEFNQLDCTNALRDGRVAGDVWLCLVDRIDGPHELAVDVVERLEDGTLPK